MKIMNYELRIMNLSSLHVTGPEIIIYSNVSSDDTSILLGNYKKEHEKYFLEKAWAED